MKSFCIIGAGISGIVSAKHCKEQGYNVIVLEKNKEPGGVWYNKSYPGIQLQTTKKSYAFSDFPHFSSTKLYPDGKEVIEYIQAYINNFQLSNLFRFNCNVINTKFLNNKWNITYVQNNKTYTIQTDYLLIASGMYNTKKPIYKEPESKNIVTKNIYSVDDIQNNIEVLKNKNVVIIGNGPTGCDMAAIAESLKAKKVTIIYRSNRWLFRRYLWDKYSADNFLTRFSMILANFLPNILFTTIIIILYYVVYVLGHGYWFFIKPPFENVNRNNIVLNDKILQLIYQKKISYIQTKNTYIFDNYIIINNNHNIPYDIIINATGYKSEIPFLKMKDIPFLYKNIIHPQLPNCAFIGFAASFNWIQVSELQIIWYLNYLKKNKPLEKDYMVSWIQKKKKGLSSHDYNDFAMKSFEYCDNLAKDIGIKKKYNCLQYKYWFSSPEHNLWSRYNK